MKCKDIISVMERLAPPTLACEGDNVGLLCGDEEQEVSRVLLSLDVDLGVIEEAVKYGAQMIVAHHPIMYARGLKNVTEQTAEGRILRALIKNNISFFASHTNLDVAAGGLNDLLADKVGLSDVEVLECTDGNGPGLGRIGRLEKPCTLRALSEHLKDVLKLDFLRYSGDADELVSRIAVNTGGGTGQLSAAIEKRADVFITGDYRYHEVRDAVESGMKIIDAGHYDTEIIVCELLEKYLSQQFGGAVEICITKANINVLRFM